MSTSTARRSTRVSRGSTVSNQELQTFQKSLRKKPKSTGPAKKWAQVLRPPAAKVGFKTLQWVRIEELNAEEKEAWDKEQKRERGRVVTRGKDEKKNGDDGISTAERIEENVLNGDKVEMKQDRSNAAEASTRKRKIEGDKVEGQIEDKPDVQKRIPKEEIAKSKLGDDTAKKTQYGGEDTTQPLKKRKLEDSPLEGQSGDTSEDQKQIPTEE